MEYEARRDNNKIKGLSLAAFFCDNVFQGQDDPITAMVNRCIHLMQEEVEEGKPKHKVPRVTVIPEDTWQAPPENHVRVDVDGSVNNFREGSCGG